MQITNTGPAPGYVPEKEGIMKKGIMDLIMEEMNKNLTEEQKQNGEKWERMHSEQYQIVHTEKGIFRNPAWPGERRKV